MDVPFRRRVDVPFPGAHFSAAGWMSLFRRRVDVPFPPQGGCPFSAAGWMSFSGGAFPGAQALVGVHLIRPGRVTARDFAHAGFRGDAVSDCLCDWESAGLKVATRTEIVMGRCLSIALLACCPSALGARPIRAHSAARGRAGRDEDAGPARGGALRGRAHRPRRGRASRSRGGHAPRQHRAHAGRQHGQRPSLPS